VVDTTPGTRSKFDSTDQKRPPAKIARSVSCADAGKAAQAMSMAKAAERIIGRSRKDDRTKLALDRRASNQPFATISTNPRMRGRPKPVCLPERETDHPPHSPIIFLIRRLRRESAQS
jgi:hypothetical protein